MGIYMCSVQILSCHEEEGFAFTTCMYLYLLSFVWQNLPMSIFCGEFPPFLRTFFCSWKRKILSKFLFHEGGEKKIAKKRIQIS